MIPVHENYTDYHPPRYVTRSIARLLGHLPKNYVSGLHAVVLTEAKAVRRGKTRRVQGRKYKNQECLGFYHPLRRGEPPWIEIVVDNVINSWPYRLTWLPFMQDVMFSTVLYHEVGHHLERTIGAPAPRGEAAADAWQERLQAKYMLKRYWYLRPAFRVAVYFLKRFNPELVKSRRR